MRYAPIDLFEGGFDIGAFTSWYRSTHAKSSKAAWLALSASMHTKLGVDDAVFSQRALQAVGLSATDPVVQNARGKTDIPKPPSETAC